MRSSSTRRRLSEAWRSSNAPLGREDDKADVEIIQVRRAG